MLPYLATSLSTVYLAFDINHASETGSGFLFSPHVAEQLLHIIEPLQVGYGAVVSSQYFIPHSYYALTCKDSFFLGGHPLGFRVGQIRRCAWLPTLCLRSHCASGCMAYHPTTHRIRSDLPILRFHVLVLRRRKGCG